MAVPIFSNMSQEVGPEAYFTNALIREFERSRVARVTNKSEAPVYIEGVITGVGLEANSQVAANKGSGDLQYLPRNTVINTGYRLVVHAQIKLVRSSDKEIIWKQNFTNQRVYSAPQVSVPTINSVNALYNNSAKNQNMKLLASDMMKEVHDRMTEKF